MRSRLYLIIAAVLWGLNFHFASYMLQETSFVEAASWRYIFGVVPLLLFSINSIRKMSFRNIPIKGILLVGVVGLFGFNIFFFLGLKYTSPVNAALIVSLNPMITIWLSALILKTPITRFHVIGAIISIIGVAILVIQGSVSNLLALNFNKGDLLIFIANTVFALHHIWVKQYKGSFSNLNFTTLTNLICLLCFLLLLPTTSYTIGCEHSENYWYWAMGIGTFGTAVAYLLWNQGLTQIGPDRAGIFMNIVPLSAAVSAFVLGEQLYGYHLISGVVIIAGIIISQYRVEFQRKRMLD